jgi:hypothetical protein
MLIFLRPASYDPNLYGPTGNVYSQQVTAETRGPEGVRIL